MTRLTLAGAIFLTVIAVMPDFLLFEFKVPQRIAYFFGGTGMLIVVGVLLDTMRQLETFLLQRHYDGFLRKGRIRARSTAIASAIGEAADLKTVGRLWLVLGLIFLTGVVFWFIRLFVL
jgi:preprotein translocase subunit SecY